MPCARGINAASATGKKKRSCLTLSVAAWPQRGEAILSLFVATPGQREALKAALKAAQWFQGLVHTGVNYLPHEHDVVANYYGKGYTAVGPGRHVVQDGCARAVCQA